MTNKFSIIDLTSSETLQAKGYPAFVQVKTEQEISLSNDQVGVIIGKHSFHEKGIGIFGGIVNPNWKGRLTIEFHVYGEIKITQGEKIAHVIIFQEGCENIAK